MLCCEDLKKQRTFFEDKTGKNIRNFELKMRTKSGESRHVLLSASMIHDRAGRLIGFTLIFRDTHRADHGRAGTR
jgi:PAS domain S-box-containing protein